MKDKVKNNTFNIYWDKGTRNLADYHTKHFPPSYHQFIRPTYILKGFHINNLGTDLRGCVYTPLMGWSIKYSSLTHTPVQNTQIQHILGQNTQVQHFAQRFNIVFYDLLCLQRSHSNQTMTFNLQIV